MTKDRWALAAVLLVGAGLRLTAATDCLWVDELHTAWVALGPPGEVAARASAGNQTPLFFGIEWLLVRLLGPSEWVLRGPSLLAGMLLPWVAWELTRRLLEPPLPALTTTLVSAELRQAPAAAPLLAAGLLACDPQALFYASEARPYACVQLGAALLAWLTCRRLHQDSLPLRCGWIAAATVSIHLHLTAGLAVAALALVLLGGSVWQARRSPGGVSHAESVKPWPRPSRPLTVVSDLVCVALLAAPLAPLALAVSARGGAWAQFVAAPGWWAPWTHARWSFAIAALLALAALARWRERGKPGLRSRHLLGGALVLACWCWTPAWLAFFLAHAAGLPLFYSRYLLGAAPAASIALGVCVGRVPGRWLPWGLATAALLWLVWDAGFVQNLTHQGRLLVDRKENWREAAAEMNRCWRERPLPILVLSRLIEADGLDETAPDRALRDYCLLPAQSLYPLSAPQEELLPLRYNRPGRLPRETARTIAARGGAWVYGRSSSQAVPQLLDDLREALQPWGATEVVWRASFGNVHLIQVNLRVLPGAAPPEENPS